MDSNIGNSMIKSITGAAIALILLIVIGWGAVIYLVGDKINESGGIKNTLIELGKDAKDVVKEVQEH